MAYKVVETQAYKTKQKNNVKSNNNSFFLNNVSAIKIIMVNIIFSFIKKQHLIIVQYFVVSSNTVGLTEFNASKVNFSWKSSILHGFIAGSGKRYSIPVVLTT